MMQDKLIEIFLYIPTEGNLAPIHDKDLALSLLKELPESLAKDVFLWQRDKSLFSRSSLVCRALKEGSALFYTLMKTYKKATHFHVFIEYAIQYNRIEEIKYLISSKRYIAYTFARAGNIGSLLDMIDDVSDNVGDLKLLACYAANGGHIEIVKKMIQMGVTDYKEIARNAAKINNKEILNYLYDIGFDNYSYVANGAVEGCHKKLLNEMITLGFNDWHDAANIAARNGHREIFNDMLRYGVDIWDYLIDNASLGGNLDIIKDIIEIFKVKGEPLDVSDFNRIAYFAAESDHIAIVKEMLSLGANNYNDIISAAAECDHRNIVDMILSLKASKIYDKYDL